MHEDTGGFSLYSGWEVCLNLSPSTALQPRCVLGSRSAPEYDVQQDTWDDADHDHRPNREVEASLIALDRDVPGQATERQTDPKGAILNALHPYDCAWAALGAAGLAVTVDGNAPWFTPASSGIARSDGAAALARFVARYNETGSLRPGDYHDVTRNSFYYAALLRAGGYRGRA